MSRVGHEGPWPEALESATAAVVDELVDDRAVARIWARDHTLFQPDPTEVADRLGWLDVADKVAPRVDDLIGFARACAADGLTDAVVLGMGGSSLFPEVLARTYEPAPDALRLRTLDTTDPAAIRRLGDELDTSRTLFIAASKSGTTIETRSQLEHFWSVQPEGANFMAITDPGTELIDLAAARRFRALFENPPDIGGRFAALSLFGLVPAALMGVDLGRLLAGASDAAMACRDEGPDNPAVQVAAAIVAAARDGRDKLTLVDDPRLASFGLWFEQLIAESTGKHGKGVLPVVGESTGPTAHGPDRLFVRWAGAPPAPAMSTVSLTDWGADDLGALVFAWEMITALVGAGLGINPFDQPDVASAKSATSAVLERGLGVVEEVPVDELVADVAPGDYVALTAYVDPASPVVATLASIRQRIGADLGVATTFGLGPRFLHSTGQLHKGGPPTGVILQVVGDDPVDVPIPGRDFGFATLKHAQAEGDLVALRDRGVRAGRVSVDDLVRRWG